MPACRPCNNYKRDSKFDPTPIVQLVIQSAVRKANDVRARVAKFKNDASFHKLLAQLEGLAEAGKLEPEQAKLIIEVASKVQDAREPELASQPFRVTPRFSVRTREGNSFIVPDWEDYEETLIAELLLAFQLSEVQIQKGEPVSSKQFGMRPVDLLLKGRIGAFRVAIVVDCSCYNRQVEAIDIEAFVELIEDVGATKGIIATSQGYSAEAEATITTLGQGNVDLDLTIFRMGELKPHQAFVALPFKVPAGIVLRAPAGWLIDTRWYLPSFDESETQLSLDQLGGRVPGLAFLYRRGQSFEDALERDCFVYCNLTSGTTIEALARYQEKNHPKYKPEWLPLKASETLRTAKLRYYPMEDGRSQEHTLFVDFGPFIFWAVLITPLDADALAEWALGSLLKLATTIIPFRVRQISENQTVWRPLKAGGEAYEFSVADNEIKALKDTFFSENSDGDACFANIRLSAASGNTWRQMKEYRLPECLEHFKATFKYAFELWEVHAYSDPVFEIFFQNKGVQNLTVARIGLRVMQVASYMFGYGVSGPSEISVNAELVVLMPDLKNSLRKRTLDFRQMNPVDIDQVSSVALEEEYLLRPNTTFRHTLRLQSFIENIPNLCAVRFLVFTDRGIFQSPDVHIRGL